MLFYQLTDTIFPKKNDRLESLSHAANSANQISVPIRVKYTLRDPFNFFRMGLQCGGPPYWF
jgi:hypothetical protein